MHSRGAPSVTRHFGEKKKGRGTGGGGGKPHVMGIDNGGKVLDFEILLIRRDAQHSCVYLLSSLLPKSYTL